MNTPSMMNKEVWHCWLDMTDPNLDGFTGWYAKQKLYLLKQEIERVLQHEKVPHYVGEDEWLEKHGIL